MLDSASTSSVFRWLKLVIVIIAKPTVVGVTIARMTLLERCYCNEHYRSECVRVQVHFSSKFIFYFLFCCGVEHDKELRLVIIFCFFY
jgi:hypothetical protein